MGARLRFGPLTRLSLLLLPLVVLLTGCSTGDPLDTLTDRGSTSGQILDLFNPVFYVAVFVFFAVEGLLLYTIIRFRHKAGDDTLPKQTHGNTRLEIGWTILPSVVLAVIAVPTIATIVDLSSKPADPLTIRVVAHQWWWEFIYPGPDGQQVRVANEMHFPVGRKIFAEITSEDVIHSFWVPNLAGKQDAVPGRLNDLTFDAKQPGVYQGQCAEFCGDSHALMRFLAVAEPQGQFDQWLANQAKPGAPPTSPSALRGQQVLMGNACIGCHGIEGSAAQGRVGPNLTHFGTRVTLGANRLENTPENVANWIRNPQAYKPGAKMPSWAGTIPDEDIKAIADYLETLK